MEGMTLITYILAVQIATLMKMHYYHLLQCYLNPGRERWLILYLLSNPFRIYQYMFMLYFFRIPSVDYTDEEQALTKKINIATFFIYINLVLFFIQEFTMIHGS